MSHDEFAMEIQPLTPDYFEDFEDDAFPSGKVAPEPPTMQPREIPTQANSQAQAILQQQPPQHQSFQQQPGKQQQPHQAVVQSGSQPISVQQQQGHLTPNSGQPHTAIIPNEKFNSSLQSRGVLAASQQTRALFEQQQRNLARSQPQQAIPASLAVAAASSDVDLPGISELESQVRDAVQQGYPPAELKVLYAALLAKQRGASICVCRHIQRCTTCLNCAASHCQCSAPAVATEAVAAFPAGSPTAPRQTAASVKSEVPHPSTNAVISQMQPNPPHVAPTPQPPLPHQQPPTTPQLQHPQTPQQPRRRVDISEVAQYYVTANSIKAGLACDPCSNTQCDIAFTCDGCSRGVHLECVTKEPDMLPRGSWYCRSCLPEAAHIYYPEKLPPMSILEIGRMLQIVTGSGSRLPLPTQIEYVEAFIKKIPTTGATRLFIHNKSKVARTH